MRLFILSAALVVAACASTDAPAGPQRAQSAPNYQDARSSASDAEVRDARRAYRAACQDSQSDAFCECMTGGMAQALSPSDLAIATAAFTGRALAASEEARRRVAEVRQDVERGCGQFR